MIDINHILYSKQPKNELRFFFSNKPSNDLCVYCLPRPSTKSMIERGAREEGHSALKSEKNLQFAEVTQFTSTDKINILYAHKFIFA